MRPPCSAEPHKPLKSQQASTTHSHPLPKTYRWSHYEPGKRAPAFPARCHPHAPWAWHTLGSREAIQGLPLAFHRHCTEQAQPNPQGFPGTLFVPPPCHRYPSLPSTLNSSPIGISLSFCKQIQLLPSPLLPMLATSYYPCFCPDFCTHAFLLLLALFSLMAAHHITPLHLFFHLRDLYSIADSQGMQFLQPLRFPCAE